MGNPANGFEQDFDKNFMRETSGYGKLSKWEVQMSG